MTLNRVIDAVFFDLDGTLMDTAPDLATACNRLLGEYQLPEVPLEKFREWVHGGAAMMICESFQMSIDHPDFLTIKSAFLNYYQQQIVCQTQLFDGIDELLRLLDHKKIPWGVVTNKPQKLTQPLMAHFGLTLRSCATVCGDTLSVAKPHPAPLLYACELTGVSPLNSVYVGDTAGDIQAAQAAGMISIAVDYGYKPSGVSIEKWMANHEAMTTQHLLSFFSSFPPRWR